MSCCLGRF
ncbi:hypothetical protein PGIGA_G00088420 [Pangasianodon gigas]|uniref:Uncharacterized protein n=1 Tax=Pangasianodon gigas TaxID=30993 RepID=A0ACC5XBF9_PANGG|nr:hypothetical protein [Pangasianodon gigas]